METMIKNLGCLNYKIYHFENTFFPGFMLQMKIFGYAEYNFLYSWVMALKFLPKNAIHCNYQKI